MAGFFSFASLPRSGSTAASASSRASRSAWVRCLDMFSVGFAAVGTVSPPPQTLIGEIFSQTRGAAVFRSQLQNFFRGGGRSRRDRAPDAAGPLRA